MQVRLGPSFSSTIEALRYPEQINPGTTDAERRANAILTGLWSGGAVTGVTPLGGRVTAPMPPSLREALGRGPDALNTLLLQEDVDVPDSVADWGSGGDLLGAPNSAVGRYFFRIFEHIEQNHPQLRITPMDLFHGHVFSCGPSGSVGPQGGELGILFHAREYPSDLEPKGQHSGFTTLSPGYADRNLLFLASTGRVYTLDTRGENHALLSNLELAPFLPPSQSPERINAVDEGAFYGLGAKLPDVNLLPSDPVGGGANDHLFFKGYRPIQPETLAPPSDPKIAEYAKILGQRPLSACHPQSKDPPGPDDKNGGHSLLSIRLLT